jgi:hypothetical protein
MVKRRRSSCRGSKRAAAIGLRHGKTKSIRSACAKRLARMSKRKHSHKKSKSSHKKRRCLKRSKR